jgi:putative endopeptidase
MLHGEAAMMTLNLAFNLSVMRPFASRILIAALLIASCSSSTLSPDGGHGYDTANLDRTRDPCSDFYSYAMGGWAERTPIPAASPEFGTISSVVEKNRETLRRLIEESAALPNRAAGSNEQKIGDFYASCMAEDRINAAGITPIASELTRINSMDDAASLAKELALLHSEGVDALFAVESTQDPSSSKQVILEIGQGGLGLPAPADYLKNDESSTKTRDEYVGHVTTMLQLSSENAAQASNDALAIAALETSLARASMTRAQNRDPVATSNRMTLPQLQAAAPHFAWDVYLDAIAVPSPAAINVRQPDFIRAMDRELANVPMTTWRAYFRWQLLHRSASMLGRPFVDEDFRFNSGVLTGTTEMPSRSKRCVRATDAALTGALGQLYVSRNFQPAAKVGPAKMVSAIVAAFRDAIDAAAWMDRATKTEARRKLDSLVVKIGYPQQWHDDPELAIERDDYLLNSFRAAQSKFRRDLRRIGKPADRTEWTMSPQTPNASYNPAMNEITLPAAVFQPPLYDPKADDALNYGALGVLIAHEITHAFDDRGAKFDADGNLRNWRSDESLAMFRALADCLIRQFNDFIVTGAIHQNGNLVVGESMADLGGLTIALAAYRKASPSQSRTATDGFTPEQRFFLAYARMFAVNIRPEYARVRAETDNHPIGSSRVNGPLANMNAFAAAFRCKAGDAMVAPRDRACSIW